MDKEEMRKAFEEWATSKGYVVLRADAESFHTYELQHVEDIWLGWQAAMTHSCEGKAELVEALVDAVHLINNLVQHQGARLSPAGEERVEGYQTTLSRHGD